MEPIFIPGADDTPEISLNKSKNIFTIIGRSLPEDVIEFYSPVFAWFEEYVADPLDNTLLQVKVDYFNSASQRALNEIFTILTRISHKGKTVKVEWFYNPEDDEMREAGEEYADITKLPFQFINQLQ